MPKIALPAVAAGIDFTKEHWKDIGIVYLKLIPIFLAVFGINLGMGIGEVYGPPTTMMHSIVIHGSTVLTYVGEMLFVLPLTIACLRTALLKEPFDRSIYSRIFNTRELTFFRWYLTMMLIATAPILFVLAGMVMSDMSLDNPAGLSPIVTLALGLGAIICFYFMFRLFYVMPAIATDKPMSFPLMWEMSRNKAWPMFKTGMLIVLLGILFGGVFGGLVGSVLAISWNPVIIGILGILGFILYVAIVGISLGAVAHIYKTLEKESSKK